jgi:hypothetical protein
MRVPIVFDSWVQLFFLLQVFRKEFLPPVTGIYPVIFVNKPLTIWYGIELLFILVLKDSVNLSTTHDRVLPNMFKILKPQQECIVCHNSC